MSVRSRLAVGLGGHGIKMLKKPGGHRHKRKLLLGETVHGLVGENVARMKEPTGWDGV